MASLRQTPLYQRHVDLGAQMVPFGGWEMPVQYPTGILQEHLRTRRYAGLFDVSHMGRFVVHGEESLPFLQYVLTNNAAALEPGQSQYTIIPDPQGGAIDDAYLYRFYDDSYLLVVNAANREQDWDHLQTFRNAYPTVRLTDQTHRYAMFSLQGPRAKAIVQKLITNGRLPDPQRNALSIVRHQDTEIHLARTGYTGEPLCFELFVPADSAVHIWDELMELGAAPIGLGARDTLRLEAGLPLYGHELGQDPSETPIPVFALPLARLAVSFAAHKGSFIGKDPLRKQFLALKDITMHRYDRLGDLPKSIRPLELIDKGIARAGAPVFQNGTSIGWITSGTMVPYWQFDGDGLDATISDQTARRAIALALIDSRVQQGEQIEVDVRGKRLKAGVMPYLLRSEAPPYARPYTWIHFQQSLSEPTDSEGGSANLARHWIRRAMDNHTWRQKQCINLIPSEQTPSALVRLLSITDPAGRYAEHKAVKAFADADIFYYQGTDFISAVESALADQMRTFLGCRQVETRPISGQMANMVVFSALVDHFNRTDRKQEQRRIRMVMNHHIIKGGHLSAQPMGALRDYVMRDPVTERPALINFPVSQHNPYDIDIDACRDMIFRYKPELIILGKSMTLQKEPVAAMRRLIDETCRETGRNAVLMYDMAHVLGLCGPHFQEPFAEGADLVTGSTHKTFFGTQRGIVAGNFNPERPDDRQLWEAIERRAFPGAVSNHHLGTLLGLLVAAMEMNAFKSAYQYSVLNNAKSFARALHETGLQVAGDPDNGFTETHQVIVEVGYAQAPAIARQLETNNIICNYQATAEEEGFTAAGALRLGVAEMTRFGMQPEDFQNIAQLMADVILRNKNVKKKITQLREQYLDMQYCFKTKAINDLIEQLHKML